jgi:hypothetical protein
MKRSNILIIALAALAVVITAMRAKGQIKPEAGMTYLAVLHDHGQAGEKHCVGYLEVGNGVIRFRGVSAPHRFQFPLSQVREVEANKGYMEDYDAFHVEYRDGRRQDFIYLTVYGQFQMPNEAIKIISEEMKKAEAKP